MSHPECVPNGYVDDLERDKYMYNCLVEMQKKQSKQLILEKSKSQKAAAELFDQLTNKELESIESVLETLLTPLNAQLIKNTEPHAEEYAARPTEAENALLKFVYILQKRKEELEQEIPLKK